MVVNLIGCQWIEVGWWFRMVVNCSVDSTISSETSLGWWWTEVWMVVDQTEDGSELNLAEDDCELNLVW